MKYDEENKLKSTIFERQQLYFGVLRFNVGEGKGPDIEMSDKLVEPCMF